MASRSKLDTNGADDVDFDFFDTPRPETESEVGEANKTDSDGDAVTVNVTDTDTASAANNSRVGEINKPDDSTIVSFVGSQKDNANCTKSSAFGSNNLDLSPSDSDTADRPIPRPRPRPRSHHVNDDVKRQSLALHLPSPEDKKKADYSLSSTDTESDSCSMSASETDDDSQYIPQKPPSRDAKQKPHNCRKSSSEPNCNESRLKSRSKNAWVEATTTTSMSQKPPAPKSSVTYHQQSKYNRISSKANTEQFSGSSTSDDSYTSNSDESDVTDVSPLASPHEYSRTLTGKPPKSPSTSKNAASGKLHLPNASRDAIDLKLLMQAVLELEHDAPPSSIRSGAHSQSSTVLFAPRPTSGCRKNFSFSDDQVRTIDLENHRLMRQIGRSGERPTAAAAAVRLNVSRRAQTTQRLTPSAVNRLREQERVAAENQALMHRLQSAQASRSLRRDTLLDDYSRQTIAGSAPHAASPLRLTHKKHNPYSLRCRSDASFDDASVTSSTSSRWSAGGQGRPRSAVSSISKASSATGRPRSATLRRKRKPEAPRPEWQAGW